MNILVISANQVMDLIPAVPVHAAWTVLALSEAGHSVNLVDLCFAADWTTVLQARLDQVPYDLAVVSIDRYENQGQVRPDVELAQAVISWLKQGQTMPVVVCGLYFSQLPEVLMPYLGADFGVIGETEAALPELLNAILHNHGDWNGSTAVPGVIWKGDTQFDLTCIWNVKLGELPMPECENYDQRYLTWAEQHEHIPLLQPWGVQTRRGCPYKCANCRTSDVEGSVIRCRSMDSIIEELDVMLDRCHNSNWFLLDHLFQFPYRHLNDLCRGLSGRAQFMKWTAFTCNGLESIDLDMLMEMKAAGCEGVVAEISTLHDEIIASLGKTYTIEHILRVCRWVRRAGLRLCLFMSLGFPEENIGMVEDFMHLLKEIAPDWLSLEVGLEINPGTQLSRELANVMLPPVHPAGPGFYISPRLEAKTLAKLITAQREQHPAWSFRCVFGEPLVTTCSAAINRIRELEQ